MLGDAPDAEVREGGEGEFFSFSGGSGGSGGVGGWGGGREHFGDEIRLGSVVVALEEVAPGHGDVVFDGVVKG